MQLKVSLDQAILNVLSEEKSEREGIIPRPDPPMLNITHSRMPQPTHRKFINMTFASFLG